MAVRIALLRGVNVSGAGKLPMAQFRAILADLGLGQVATYIQSGNAIFDSDLEARALETLIRDAIAERFGFAPETFVLTSADIASALSDHPFAAAEPQHVHVFFLRETPAPDDAILDALAQPGDGWHIGPGRLTLHTPGGIGSSKLAEKLPRLLPMPMTARNLRTVAALHAMAAVRA